MGVGRGHWQEPLTLTRKFTTERTEGTERSTLAGASAGIGFYILMTQSCWPRFFSVTSVAFVVKSFFGSP